MHDATTTRLAPATIFLLLTAGIAWSQPARPRFDVASIKPAAPVEEGRRSGQVLRDPGRVTYRWVSVQNLISQAYLLKNTQIAGPEWLDNERFDIVAAFPQATTDENFRAMLQSLLDDRFKLAFHTETRNLRAYGLLVARNGLKAAAVEGDVREVQTRINGPIHHLSGKVTMPYLAGLLANLVDRPVLDLTESKGVYDVALAWSDETRPAAADDPPSLFTALQETLGLRLDNRTAPVEVSVIDRIVRVPVEN